MMTSEEKLDIDVGAETVTSGLLEWSNQDKMLEWVGWYLNCNAIVHHKVARPPII